MHGFQRPSEFGYVVLLLPSQNLIQGAEGDQGIFELFAEELGMLQSRCA